MVEVGVERVDERVALAVGAAHGDEGRLDERLGLRGVARPLRGAVVVVAVEQAHGQRPDDGDGRRVRGAERGTRPGERVAEHAALLADAVAVAEASDVCDIDDYADVEFEEELGDGELCADGYNTCTEGMWTWCCGGDYDHCTDDALMCSSLSESEKKKAVQALAGALLAMIIIPILCVCGCVIAGMVMCCKKRPVQQGTTAGGGIGMT